MTLLLLLGCALAANAAEVAIPPAPTAWVTDTAAFLMPQTVDSLDTRLRAYQTTTGHQILVYIAPTTGATPTEEWTSRAFARWKVGRKGIDDGLVMFVFPTDREVRIEVGYGLEQTVPDAIASRIIRNTITPKIRDGKPDEAIVSGVNDILATVGGEAIPQSATSLPATPLPATPAPDDGSTDSGADPVGVVIGIVLALLIIVVIGWLIGKIPSGRETYIGGRDSGFGLGDVLSIGLGILGSGGSSGGGFSGGGGMGGGGGATGSW